jgi:lantibiotic biosynthesis protein
VRGQPAVIPAWWGGCVPPDLADRVRAEVSRFGERLRDADAILRETSRARAQTSGPYFFKPESFSSGFPSVALFYAYLAAAQPGRGWDQAAREFMTRSAEATRERAVTQPGLYSGSAGLAFSLHCMAGLDPRYGAAAARAYEQVATQVLACHPRTAGYTDTGDLDVISGDAGVLAALLAVAEPSAAVAGAIDALIRDLVTLCAPDSEPAAGKWLTHQGVPI